MKPRFLLPFLLLLASSAQAAMPGVPANGQLGFTVTRNGDPIGRLVYNFEDLGQQQIVRVETRILFKFLGIPVYRFEQDSTEIWERERLNSLSSRTNDNGDLLDLEAKEDGNAMQMTLNGQKSRLDGTNLPASLWNPATAQAETLFDTTDGKLFEVDSKTENGRVVLSGELDRDIGYDSNGVLNSVRFTASDGSEIRYVRD